MGKEKSNRKFVYRFGINLCRNKYEAIKILHGGVRLMKELVRAFLQQIGEDVEREGLINTPERVEKAYRFLTKGYNENEEDIINQALFKAQNHDMVIVKDIEFYSLCEHHILPFFGKVCVAYIPNEKIIGLSKVCRIVEMYSRRLQVQEKLTSDIADSLSRWVKPQGIAVSIEATHLCMAMRGVRNQNAKTVTYYFGGVFEENENLKRQFLREI